MLVSAVVFLVKIYVQCGLVDAVLLLYRFFIRFHKIEPVKDAIGQDEARKELKLCRCVVFHTSKVRSFDTQTYLQVYVYVTLCHGSLQVSLEKLCAVIGFTKDMIENLLTKKESIQCSGKIYSEEHRWKFDIKNDIFRVEKHPMDSGKLMLTINRQPIVQWFKEQWEKLQQNLRNSVQREQKSRGFRI